MIINTNYSRTCAQKIYSNKSNSQIASNIKPKTEDSSNGSKKISVEYILEGCIINVYLIVDGDKKQCIKSIPLSQATPDILAKVKNITFGDILRILEMQKGNKMNQYNKNTSHPKEETND